MLEAIATSPEAVTFTGISASYLTRWVSGTNSGLLPLSKIRALVTLYESGQPFEIETDYFRELGSAPVIYANCYFSPGDVPAFGPSEVIDYFLVDMLIRIPVASL